MGFWERIPPKLLVVLTLIAFVYMGAAITYALYKNTPVEMFFGFVKFGERDDILRARLVKALADNEARIAPEVYNAALERAKVAESKSSEPNPELKSRLVASENEVGKLKVQIKERDTKIAALEKEIGDMSKERAESNRTIEALRKDLQLSQKAFQERGVQIEGLKKTVEEISLANKSKTISSFIQQLSALEKLVNESLNSSNQQAYVNPYNEILAATKKELPSDSYVTIASSLSTVRSYFPVDRYSTSEIAVNLKTSIQGLRIHLEQLYSK
jgi:hypothetical protein